MEMLLGRDHVEAVGRGSDLREVGSKEGRSVERRLPGGHTLVLRYFNEYASVHSSKNLCQKSYTHGKEIPSPETGGIVSRMDEAVVLTSDGSTVDMISKPVD